MTYSAPSHALQFQDKMSTMKYSNASVLRDMNFVLTGQPKYMLREQLRALIRGYGGKVSSIVSGETQVLVAGVNGGEGKRRRSLEGKVRIIDEDDLFLLTTGVTSS